MSEQKDSKKDLLEVFNEQRRSISKEIKVGVKLLEDSKNIPEIQVTFMSLRQRLVEDNHALIAHSNRLNKRFRDRRGEEWVNVSTNGQYRYQSTEKAVVVDSNSSLSELKLRIEQVENHINFYTESLKTVDSVLFGLRVRLDVDKLYQL